MSIESVGTAELNPGCSPGLECSLKSPVGTTGAAVDTWVLDARTRREFSIAEYFGEDCLGLPRNFQSSLRDLSSLEISPRTTSWAKFSRPCGTLLAIGAPGMIALSKFLYRSAYLSLTRKR
jgi:hypothetical protein